MPKSTEWLEGKAAYAYVLTDRVRKTEKARKLERAGRWVEDLFLRLQFVPR
ncbi:hypothetical protein EMIT043CA1_50295 [Pseudomonas brassicacearum]